MIRAVYHELWPEGGPDFDGTEAVVMQTDGATSDNSSEFTFTFNPVDIGMQNMSVSLEIDDGRTPDQQPYYDQSVGKITITVYGTWEREMLESIMRLYLAKRRIIGE